MVIMGKSAIPLNPTEGLAPKPGETMDRALTVCVKYAFLRFSGSDDEAVVIALKS